MPTIRKSAAKAQHTFDSMTRALDHHKIVWRKASAIDREPAGQAFVTVVIESGIGDVPMSNRELRCYCIGLADKERALAKEAT